MTSQDDPQRWVAHDGEHWSADAETAAEITARYSQGNPIPLAGLGPFYWPTGPDDEIAVYLWAWDILRGADVTGDPPALPPVPELPPGAVS